MDVQWRHRWDAWDTCIGQSHNDRRRSFMAGVAATPAKSLSNATLNSQLFQLQARCPAESWNEQKPNIHSSHISRIVMHKKGSGGQHGRQELTLGNAVRAVESWVPPGSSTFMCASARGATTALEPWQCCTWSQPYPCPPSLPIAVSCGPLATLTSFSSMCNSLAQRPRLTIIIFLPLPKFTPSPMTSPWVHDGVYPVWKEDADKNRLGTRTAQPARATLQSVYSPSKCPGIPNSGFATVTGRVTTGCVASKSDACSIGP